jgi:16S rRNA U1498 N3-methylase RsmE
VPARLGAVVDGKIWVVLGPEGGVLRYGVLREP